MGNLHASHLLAGFTSAYRDETRNYKVCVSHNLRAGLWYYFMALMRGLSTRFGGTPLCQGCFFNRLYKFVDPLSDCFRKVIGLSLFETPNLNTLV